MGHNNPFVTGERKWTADYKPVGSGVVQAVTAKPAKAEAKPSLASGGSLGPVLGNRNSHVYHLANGCPGYAQVTAKNQVTFATEGEAQAAGYHKAGNCR